jgi:trans-aconitate methyltransferase
MTEWRLFPEGAVPDFSTPEFFGTHPWVPPHGQIGHQERTAMVVDLVANHIGTAQTLSDLGCGDGSLLAALEGRHLPLRMWGYDAGRENVATALSAGLDVTHADFLTAQVDLGDIVVMSEVLEHLADPHGFLAKLSANRLVASTPSSETGDWHYYHHAWAWDTAGFRDLLEGAGWSVVEQRTCFGGINVHCGRAGEQHFQAVVAEREQAAT